MTELTFQISQKKIKGGKKEEDKGEYLYDYGVGKNFEFQVTKDADLKKNDSLI